MNIVCAHCMKSRLKCDARIATARSARSASGKHSRASIVLGAVAELAGSPMSVDIATKFAARTVAKVTTMSASTMILAGESPKSLSRYGYRSLYPGSEQSIISGPTDG